MSQTEPSNILVPVDFGEASAQALAVARSMAGHGRAVLRVLHAETPDVPAYFTHEQMESMAAERRQMRLQAEQFLERYVRNHISVPFEAVLDDRPPVDAILGYSSWADLIVMGTHGRRGPSRWWLGSVAERVLRETEVPLMVIRSDQRAETVLERIVVQTTDSNRSDGALRFARLLASRFGGEVIDLAGGSPDPRATLVAATAPESHRAHWLSKTGEPLLRQASAPVLFIPEKRGREPF
jgi:nucleotide-binding universal stress UspA family protein